MCFGMVFIDKMHVVAGNKFYLVFLSQFNQMLVYQLLLGIGILSRIGYRGFMTLQFQIKIIAEHFFKPTYRLLSLFQVAVEYMAGNFTAQAG